MAKVKSALGIDALTVRECQTMLIGSLDAISNDPKYFYHSKVGPQYCHLTEEGQDTLVKSMNALLPLLVHAKERELDERAKSITWNTLQE